MALGKSPITVKNAPGFVVNRILVPMINEAFFVLAEGLATAEDIDAGMKLGCNQPIGPLALADMIGLDVCLAVMEVYLTEYRRLEVPPLPAAARDGGGRAARPQDRPRRLRLLSSAMIQTAPPPEGTITTERRGPLLLIGINRPAKYNGFTPRMFRELGEAYTLLDDDDALRVGVLHAFGKHFTAGLDLPTIAPLMQRGEKAIPPGLVEPTDVGTPGMRRRRKPMVAAVKGITFTLGIELMLAADIVVAADDCRFSQLEVKRGIMATGGATLRMAERAGLGNAMLHLLTGDEFGSSEALRLNFVQRVVPAGQELEEALRIAQAHCRAGAACRCGHAPECIEGRGAGSAGRGGGFHRGAAAPVQHRGRRRGRALLRGEAPRAVQGPLGSSRCRHRRLGQQAPAARRPPIRRQPP